MITEDELKKYLPKYLSEENYKTLLAELKSVSSQKLAHN